MNQHHVYARQNGKTSLGLRATIVAVRPRAGARVVLLCHPEDHARWASSLAPLLAAEPSLAPVKLMISAVPFKGTLFAAPDPEDKTDA